RRSASSRNPHPLAGTRARRGAAWTDALILVGLVAPARGAAVRGFSGSLERAFDDPGARVRQGLEPGSPATSTHDGASPREPPAVSAQVTPSSGAASAAAPRTAADSSQRPRAASGPLRDAWLWLAGGVGSVGG